MDFLTIGPGTIIITIIYAVLLVAVIVGIVVGVVALTKVYRKYMGKDIEKRNKSKDIYECAARNILLFMSDSSTCF